MTDNDAAAKRALLPILVVDDNQDAADAFAALLQALGAEVSVCYGATDALAEIERRTPAIAFLDLGMPEMDGYELARRIRRLPGGGGSAPDRADRLGTGQRSPTFARRRFRPSPGQARHPGCAGIDPRGAGTVQAGLSSAAASCLMRSTME